MGRLHSVVRALVILVAACISCFSVAQPYLPTLYAPPYTQRQIFMAAPEHAQLQYFSQAHAGSPENVGSLAEHLTDPFGLDAPEVSWQQRLEYLRGSPALEGILRQRTSVLDAITAAQAVRVSGARYLAGMANRLENTTTYTSFLSAMTQRRAQLYVSSPQGWLHAFDAQSGRETFVFVPSAVFSHLRHSTHASYQPSAQQTSLPVVADVYDGQRWRTILVASAGRAGTGIFALDITDPDAIELLWELDEDSPVFTDLQIKPGHSVAQPSIARLHHGRWAVISGNGYQAQGSETGAAALYVLDAITGALIKSLEVQSALAQSNGLSAPRLADYDGDGVADYAYAGDVQGNLWRFDLLGDGAHGPSSNPPRSGSYGALSGGTAGFKVAFAGQPLFIATSGGQSERQPISAAPSLVPHPSGSGYLVIVGTGQEIDLPDGTDPTQLIHSLYGIWDRDTAGQSTAARTIQRDQLASQQITHSSVAVSQTSGESVTARVISQNPVEWHRGFDASAPVLQRGWVLDLQQDGHNTGEMLVEQMRTLGSMLLVQTHTADHHGVQHWLYALNPSTGGATEHQALALETPNASVLAAIEFTPIAAGAGIQISEQEQAFVLQGRDTQERIVLPPESSGRQTWRLLADD